MSSLGGTAHCSHNTVYPPFIARQVWFGPEVGCDPVSSDALTAENQATKQSGARAQYTVYVYDRT